eukprot:TCALIF_01470-PB protein Name:"Protein of unknown function" AED:0.64 eAED:0.64 QI:0/0/0.33/0.33/1/1/3/0/155
MFFLAELLRFDLEIPTLSNCPIVQSIDARVESRPTKLMVDQDDGIGSSDDDTISTASSKPEDISEPEGAERGERATPANGDGDALTPFESDSSPNLSDINRKKVIRPDQNAINRLLAFDEEMDDSPLVPLDDKFTEIRSKNIFEVGSILGARASR